MAGADQDQKTQEPTEKKLVDAREKGDVASAPEMRHAAMITAALIVTGALGVSGFARLGVRLTSLWERADDFRIAPATGQRFAGALMGQTLAAIAPLLGIMFGCALIGGLLQGRPSIAWSRVSPKWSKLSPAAGMKRILGVRALIEFAKTLAKLALVGGTAAIVLWPSVIGIDQMVGVDPLAIARSAGGLVGKLLRTIAVLIGALALFDLVYQRHSWLKRMRMTLQEVKDEHRQSEGDPHLKAKMRQIGFQRARSRMMSAVPEASVIITNPTHYAVALKYDHGQMSAPIVVAKGMDTIALKIREVAAAAGVPIVENPPLARALHAIVEVGHPVPIDHYAAVAEVIGYVLRLARQAAPR